MIHGQSQSTSKRPQVVIVGGGFAGLHAARGLSRLPVDVTLIDRKNHHTFQPLLYQVATATLAPENIAQPIRTILRDDKNVRVLMDEVTGFDLQTENGAVICQNLNFVPFDYLILASGATHSYFGNDRWAPHAPGLKTVEDALEIRRRVLSAFELAEREMAEKGTHAPLNFVVIGGGPTGVELAGAICETCRLCMTREYRLIDPAKARVMLVEGQPRILGPYPEDLAEKATRQLKDMGVEVLTSTQVVEVESDCVVTSTGRIPAATIIWAAGVQASPLGKLLGVEVDRRGCVIVNALLNPPDYRNVFVCGDLAHLEQDGKQLPGVAPCAMQMGDHAALEIACDLHGKPRPAFRYFDKGDMATIGRRRAVANVKWPFKAKLTGYFAWLSWLVIHLLFLIGLRNRIMVLLEWMWTYFARGRGVRLITYEHDDQKSEEYDGEKPSAASGG